MQQVAWFDRHARMTRRLAQAVAPVVRSIAGQACGGDARFAAHLRPFWRGIVSRVRWPMHTGQLEGINNKIKLIKRQASGYRGTDYFFLKIRAAFPGNPGRTKKSPSTRLGQQAFLLSHIKAPLREEKRGASNRPSVMYQTATQISRQAG